MKRVEEIAQLLELDFSSYKNEAYFKGSCYLKYIKGFSESSVKQSVTLTNGEDRYNIPLTNIIMEDGKVGFEGKIDLGFINTKDSLSPGFWILEIYLITDIDEYVGNASLNLDLNESHSKLFKNKKLKAIVEIAPELKEEVFGFKSSVASEYSVNNKKMLKALYKFIKFIKRNTIKIIYNTAKKLPLKKDVVLFLSDSREDLSGNFAFVYEEIKNRGGYKVKKFLKPSLKANLGFFEKFKFLYAVATSKYILLDDFYPKIYNFKLREEVELVQLWHACGAFKTFGFSRLGKEGGPKMRAKNHRNYTKAIVSSEDIRKHYAEGFGISEKKVIATGVPRTDIFFDEEYKKSVREDLYRSYPILKGKKVIMFAPTFRGNGQSTAYYDFDKFEIEKMYKEFSDEYVVIMKMHPFVKDIPIINDKYKNFILDFSNEREINDFLLVSDILITDYSSVCFEYALLGGSMIFFAYDMDEYISKRDFYYPYKGFVPGPIVKTTDGIIDVIKTGNYEKNKLKSFTDRFFSHLDGKSTQRTVDAIFMKKEN